MDSANPTAGLQLVDAPTTPAAEPGPDLLDSLGRRRGEHTRPGYKRGNTPTSKGRKYPPQAFTNAEAEALFQNCIPTHYSVGRPGILGGERLRALCVVMFRTGLRVQEALDLEERDLDRDTGQITVRQGKGAKRRVVGMDPWGWAVLDRWLEIRREFPPGPVFPTLLKGHEGRPWDQSDVRRAMKKAGKRAGLRRRCTPHQLRHGFAVTAWREGIDILSIQRALGHSRLDVTQAYLVSLGADDLLTPVTERKAPMVPMVAAPPPAAPTRAAQARKAA